jgi:type IV pilus assembly protein PilO
MSASRPSSVWSERLKSPLTWHIVGFVVLLIITVAFGIRLGLDWTATNRHSNDVFAGKQVELKALELETAPLRGLDGRVDQAREKMAGFEQKRIPPNYSSIDARIEELQLASGVRLARVQYTQAPRGPGLTEISVDTNISGDYPAIMRFVNSIERNQTFFVIRTMSFTGAQGGLVNLRMQLSTWLRPGDAAASGLPLTPQNDQNNDQAPNSSTTSKEGL